MSSKHPNLSLEQELQVKIIELSSGCLSRMELQSAIVEFTRQLMVKENVISHLMQDFPFTEAGSTT